MPPLFQWLIYIICFYFGGAISAVFFEEMRSPEGCMGRPTFGEKLLKVAVFFTGSVSCVCAYEYDGHYFFITVFAPIVFAFVEAGLRMIGRLFRKSRY